MEAAAEAGSDIFADAAGALRHGYATGRTGEFPAFPSQDFAFEAWPCNILRHIRRFFDGL